ncbi:hypothetical protein HZH66_008388 [Vespula vulgaris]|uniref:Uncharacterized protein n=1 Tax=Vespula vulgaris TaxID=7454 RepID=A0A834N1P6_VESVU|nr:hypothetical protein HZH66_008388 [Vespula vulgaris]
MDGDHERSEVTVAEGEAIRSSTIVKRVPLTNDIGEVPRQVVAATYVESRKSRSIEAHDHFLWLNAYNNLVTTRIEDPHDPRGFDKDTMQGVLSGPVVDQYRSRANRPLSISIRSNRLPCLKMFWLVRWENMEISKGSKGNFRRSGLGHESRL